MTAPPLRLMLDARMARHGGIGTYIRHLVGALMDTGEVAHGCVAGAPPGIIPVDGTRWCRQPFAPPVYHLRESWSRPANPHRAQLWHSPHFNAPLRWRGPLIVTLHDLIPITHPSWTKMPWAAPYAAWMLRRVVRRADALIAVSNATKRAVCRWAQLPEDRVTVIPHGVSQALGNPVDPTDRARLLAEYGVQPPFILWVSAIRPHKNPLTALQAFARLRAKHRILHQLVMVGHRPSWYSTPREEARRLGIDQAIRWIEGVPEPALPALYQGARALIMPSYEEGFGLPVLEAMAAGCPVLVSTAPALLELIENAGLAIDPDNIDGWSEHLYTVMLNDTLHHRLQQQGRERASRFTWAHTAACHLKLYRAVIRTGPAA